MKLNIACGPNLWCGADWLHYDHVDMNEAYLRHIRADLHFMGWNPEQRRLADGMLRGEPVNFKVHDLHQPFPHEDNSISAIYVGQACEHMNRRTQAPAFFRECYRMLEPGGKIRLTTPDLHKLVTMYFNPHMASQLSQQYALGPTLDSLVREQPDFYAGALPEDQLSYLMFGASGDDCTQTNYAGHFHLYTPRSLTRLLYECGFVGANDGTKSLEFRDCIDKGMSHSFAIEASK